MVSVKGEVFAMHEQSSATPEGKVIHPKKLCYEPQFAHTSVSWRLFLKKPLYIHTQEVACSVARRMRDPDFVHATAERAREQSIYPMGWSPSSLASGDVGLALLYEYMDRCFPKDGWGTHAQQYFGVAAAGTQQMGFPFPGLVGGTSGMALALSLASRGGKRYQKTLARLHQGLCEQIRQQVWRRSEADGGVADRDYDVISGAAGVLAYLVSIERPDGMIQAAVESLLAYLTWLAEPGQPIGKERWFIPPALLPTDRHRAGSPQGDFNCGLAHGIPGPLATLALTWLAGYRYPGLRESIAYLAGWIEEHHVDTPWGNDWPGSVPLEYAADPRTWQNLSPTRAAWCYGAPGISRSLWLAGQALDDEHIRRVAVEAIETVLRRPAATLHLPSPHICHGIAGLLQICLRFANECESTLVREYIPILTQQLLDAFDPASVLGFYDMDEDKPLDKPHWLTGASGIVMVLLAASTSVAPDWDRALVIA